jgi:hypothetical protein
VGTVLSENDMSMQIYFGAGEFRNAEFWGYSSREYYDESSLGKTLCLR